MNVLCSNICGLRNNFDELKLVIRKRKPDVIFLNETHLTDDCDISDLKIINYECIHCKSFSKHTGGVSVFINSRVKYEMVSIVEQNIAWYLSFEININRVSTVLAGGNKSEVLNSFNEWFENISDGKQILVCGDFNVDLMSNTSHAQKLKNICCDNGMTQLIEKPTRVERNSSTLIDLCITNINRGNISSQVLIEDQITDHAMIDMVIQGKTDEIRSKNREVTVWSGYDNGRLWQSLENEIQHRDLVRNSSVNDKMDWLLDILCKSTEQFKKTKVVKTIPDLFDRNLEQMRRRKNELYKLARYASESEADNKWHEYRVFKN